jgi:hypothetical protein
MNTLRKEGRRQRKLRNCALIWTATIILAMMVSCTRNLSMPIMAIAVTNTPTKTAIPEVQSTLTFTNTPTPTNTNCGSCAPTNTPTSTNTPIPTNTPGGMAATVVYDNGAMLPGYGCYYCSFSGGGDTSPTANAANTAPSSYPNGETSALSFTFGTLIGGGGGPYSGDTVLAATSVSVTPPPYPNFEGYTTCTFYAYGSIAGPLAFEVIVPEAGSANAVSEPLTTSWTQYSLTIKDGSRSDGLMNSSPPGTSIADVGSWLVVLAVSSSSSNTPSNDVIYIDDMTCQ